MKMTNTSLELPKRTRKPRVTGITSIHEVGCPIGELRSILEDYHEYIDIAKLGLGSAYISPRLEEKLALYREYDVVYYFGGTLFEKFYHQSKLDDYAAYLKGLGVSWIEISTGTVDIPLDERIRLVEQWSRDFTVLSEVGTKDEATIMPPSLWIKEIKALLAAGSRYVITEGRNSGTVGIYRRSGEIRTGLVADIIAETSYERIIFEAPKAANQLFLINQIGSNANLGNVSPRDLLQLETQRVGLRNETFFIKK